MPNAICPACHESLAADTSSSHFCPACGFDLASAPPTPGWVVKGVDLRMVARRQRLLLWFVLASLLLMFLPTYLSSVHPLLGVGGGLVMLTVQILIVVGVVQMLSALRTIVAVRVLYILLLFVPCVGLIMLLVANQLATRALQQAGLRVGILGVRDEEVLRVLDLYRCRKCSYSLIGNVSGRCPECGTPTGLVAPSPRSTT